MGFDLFNYLPRFMKEHHAKIVRGYMESLEVLKETNIIASTYLLPISIEDYLRLVDNDFKDYHVMPICSNCSSSFFNPYKYRNLQTVEEVMDARGVDVGIKLFGGKDGTPDIDLIMAKKIMIDEARDLNAEIVVCVISQSNHYYAGYSVDFEGIALVPKN